MKEYTEMLHALLGLYFDDTALPTAKYMVVLDNDLQLVYKVHAGLFAHYTTETIISEDQGTKVNSIGRAQQYRD